MHEPFPCFIMVGPFFYDLPKRVLAAREIVLVSNQLELARAFDFVRDQMVAGDGITTLGRSDNDIIFDGLMATHRRRLGIT